MANTIIEEDFKVEVTEEVAKDVDAVKKEIIAKRAATLAKKEDAKEKLLAYVAKTPSFKLKEEVIFLCKTVQTSERKPRTESQHEVLKQALIDAGSDGLSEMAIFKQFKMGRPEMSIKTRVFVKTKEPKNRVWIEFNEKEEIYRIVATGAKAPKDWEGYVPAEEAKI